MSRIYATLASDGCTANLMLTPEEQEFKCLLIPAAFAPLANAWSKKGATAAILAQLSELGLRAALEMAWRHALPAMRKTKTIQRKAR